MTTFFDFMPSLLPRYESLYESPYATSILRLTSEHRVHLDSTQHVYRLPGSTPHLHYTHYKVALHGATGLPQRIPFLIIATQENILQKKDEPSMEWHSLPPFAPLEAYLYVGIPHTVCSEHCVLTILLKGVSMDSTSPKPSNLSR